MISAYFLEKSWRKKTRKQLIIDKLKRLGIPLVFYALFISPIIVFLVTRFDEHKVLSVFDFFTTVNWIELGPLWFIVALLLFIGVAILLKSKKTTKKIVSNSLIQSNWNILLFAVILGIVSFVVRIWFPVGYKLEFVGFQLAHFTQYIALFYVGIIASKNDWFTQISYQQGVKWLKLALVFVLILFPIIFYFGGVIEHGISSFMGGLGWQSFLYAMWEQILGVSIIIGLIGLFKEKYNTQNDRLKAVSASSYTVYLIHALILVSLSLLMENIKIDNGLKFLILTPISLLICFFVSNSIRKLPYLREIL